MIKNINRRVSKQLTLMLWCFLPNEALPQHAHNQSVSWRYNISAYCTAVACMVFAAWSNAIKYPLYQISLQPHSPTLSTAYRHTAYQLLLLYDYQHTPKLLFILYTCSIKDLSLGLWWRHCYGHWE